MFSYPGGRLLSNPTPAQASRGRGCILCCCPDVELSQRVRQTLQSAGWRAEVLLAETLSCIKKAILAHEPELILARYFSGAVGCLKILELLRELESETPVVILDERIGEEAAMFAARAGAVGYVHVQNLELLPEVIQRARGTSARAFSSEAADGFRARLNQEESVPGAEARPSPSSIPVLDASSGPRPGAAVDREVIMASAKCQLACAGQPLAAARAVADAAQVLLGWDACFVDLLEVGAAEAVPILRCDVVNGVLKELPLGQSARRTGPLSQRALVEGCFLMNRCSPSQEPKGWSAVPFGDTGRGSAALLFAPIRERGRSIGVLSVQSYTSGAYSAHHLSDLQELADLLGVALGRMPLPPQGLKRRLSNSSLAMVLDVAEYRSRLDLLQRKRERALEVSAERMRLALGTGRVATWTWDSFSNVAFVSTELQKLMGLDAHGYRRGIKCLLKIVHPPDRKSLLETFRSQLGNGLELEVEFRIRRSDGTLRWVNQRAKAIRENGNAGPAVVGVVHDVSQRKQAELAAEASRKNLRQVLDTVFAFVGCFTPEGTILDLNQACLSALGLSRGEVEGRLVWSLPCWDAQAGVERMLRRALRAAGSGQTPRFEMELPLVDGTRILLDAQLGPLLGPEGEIQGILACAVNITEKRALEQGLMEAERLAATGQMAARIAHEINNPLAGIKNAVFLLRDAVKPEHRSAMYLPLIEAEIDRIGRIVTQMFDLYEPRHQRSRPIPVAALVFRVVELCKSKARAAGVKLVYDPTQCTGIEVSDGQVAQILYNLINNAIDASPSQSRVDVIVERVGDRLALKVRDQGRGVPEHLRSAIFEPYFTTKQGRPGIGLGLGLSVSRNLAESMGGTLELSTEFSCGATFVLYLPIEAPEPFGLNK